MTDKFLAIVNPAAGGGRCRKLVGPALEKLRAGGLTLDVVETHAPGEATQLTRDAYARGYRAFLGVGGDGTSYEIVNGLFPEALEGERPTLGFLPLGTGNSPTFPALSQRRGSLYRCRRCAACYARWANNGVSLLSGGLRRPATC